MTMRDRIAFRGSRSGERPRGPSVISGVLSALVLLLSGPATATSFAHGETTPVIETVVDGISGAGPGVYATTDRVQQSLVEMRNTSPTELTVVGNFGEAFLRIGPSGSFANVNSPSWYASGNPSGLALNLPASAHAGAAPRWQRVSAQAQWAWFDRRVEPPANPIPPQAQAGRKPLRLVGWSIPLRYGSSSARLNGHVEFRPAIGSVIARLRPAVGAPVTVSVLAGAAPGLFVSNLSRSVVTVIGSDGQPFARIGPGGVSVNTSSPTFVAGQIARGASIAGVPLNATPRWRKVAEVPRYGWVEPRLRYGSLAPPADITGSSHTTVLKRWSIPIETVAGRRFISGTTDWIPLEQPGYNNVAGSGHAQRLLWWLLTAAAITAAASLGALALRRRYERTRWPHAAGPAG